MQVLQALSEGLAFRVLREVTDVGTLCSCLKHCGGMTVTLGNSNQFSAPDRICHEDLEWLPVRMWPHRQLHGAERNRGRYADARRSIEESESGSIRLAIPTELSVMSRLCGFGGSVHVIGGTLNLGKTAALVFDTTCTDVHLQSVTFDGVFHLSSTSAVLP
jgi:hypothetical protein